MEKKGAGKTSIKKTGIKKTGMKRKSRWIRVLLLGLLWGGLFPAFLCDAAPGLHMAYPTADSPVLRTRPFYPPYHGIFARRRHFLCGREPVTAQEMLDYMTDRIPPVETIGEVDPRYPERCEESLSLLPPGLLYLFEDYGWHFYVTSLDIAETEFDGQYASVKGVTDVQSLYIKVEDRNNATDSSTIFHEFGHFLDYCSNFPSEKERFNAIMESEWESAEDMGMHCNPKNNEEYFAESFYWYLTDTERMRESIPQTWDFIRQCLTETIYRVHE